MKILVFIMKKKIIIKKNDNNNANNNNHNNNFRKSINEELYHIVRNNLNINSPNINIADVIGDNNHSFHFNQIYFW